MEIFWDPHKRQKLWITRGIDLDEIKGLLENEKYFDVLENPSRPGQYFMLVEYKSYAHVVVVKIESGKMLIKTCYPSRKMHKKYLGGKQ